MVVAVLVSAPSERFSVGVVLFVDHPDVRLELDSPVVSEALREVDALIHIVLRRENCTADSEVDLVLTLLASADCQRRY